MTADEEESAKHSRPTRDELKVLECRFWDSPAGRIYDREPQGDVEPQAGAEPQGQDAEPKGNLVLTAEGGVRLVFTASGLLVVEGCEKFVRAMRSNLQLLE